MTIIAATGGFGVGQVPIEDIEPGETVLIRILTNRIIAAPPEEQSRTI